MRARLTTVLYIVAAATLSAQQAQSPQTTFRTGANYVRVDMYATRDGQAVEDLTQAEVEVLEDGVPQTIEAFEYVKVRPAGPQESRIEPRSVEESRQMAAEARARVFVIFLDTYHTRIEGSANMRLPLVRFLDRVLGQDDLVAVMTPAMGALDIAFGRKTTVISNIMQDQWTWGRRGRLDGTDDDPKDQLYRACFERPGEVGQAGGVAREMMSRRREKLTLDALEDLIVHLGGVREERKAVLTVTEGWLLHRPNPKLAAPRDERDLAPPQLLGRGRPRGEPEDRAGAMTSSMRVECEADRLALSLVDHEVKLRQLTEDANRGNVTFYPVFARGLVPFDSDIGPERPPALAVDAANLRTRQESLRLLADNTDGTAVINTNNIDGALKRITDDLSSYYLFGYYSTNTKLDGRFRSITVRVKRPDVRVRARRGYRGRTAEEIVREATSSESGSAVTGALNAVAGVNARSAFRIRTSSWVRRAPEGGPQGTFWVVGELDFRTRRELVWTAGARAEVLVLAPDGQEIVSTSMKVAASDGSFSLRVPESGSLAPGEYAVRVKVQPDADGELALSDLARVIVRQEPSVFGEALLWRRGPTTGPRYLRTADPRFQRSDRLRLELPAAATGMSASARMLDRVGNALTVPVQVSERAESAGELAWIVVDASLAPLAPGDYAIEVTLGEAKQVTGFRVVP